MASFSDIVKSKFFIGVALLLIILLSGVEYKQYRDRRAVQQQINEMQAQANTWDKQNKDLQSFIAYLQTDDYKQKAARVQLNLKKPDEFVYSFAPQNNFQAVSTTPADAGQAPVSDTSVSNPHKWWNYFFNPGM